MFCPIARRLPPCTIDAILKTRSMDADDGGTIRMLIANSANDLYAGSDSRGVQNFSIVSKGLIDWLSIACDLYDESCKQKTCIKIRFPSNFVTRASTVLLDDRSCLLRPKNAHNSSFSFTYSGTTVSTSFGLCGLHLTFLRYQPPAKPTHMRTLIDCSASCSSSKFSPRISATCVNDFRLVSVGDFIFGRHRVVCSLSFNTKAGLMNTQHKTMTAKHQSMWLRSRVADGRCLVSV